MISLAFCFHDTEKNIEKWQIIAEKMKTIFNQEVVFKPFKDIYEEEVFLHLKDYDIYYANPENVIKLVDKGYIPLARFKKQKDKILIVSKKYSLDDIKSIAVVDLLISYYIIFNNLPNVNNVEIFKNYEDIISNILEDKIDAGIIYKDNFENLGKEEKLNVLKEIDVGIDHIFCVKKDFYFKNKEAINKLIEELYLEKIGGKNLEKIFKKIENIKRVGQQYRKHTYTLIINQLLIYINQLIVSSTNEEKLFQDICDLIVEKFKFNYAWIGKKYGDIIRPVCKAGDDKGYLDEVTISVREDLPEGKGPTGTAFREDRIIINENTLTNPAMQPWREKLLERSIYSSISIPFKKSGKVYAVLNVYSDRFDIFSYDMIDIFQELKKDVSFALDKIEERKNLFILEKALISSNTWIIITNDKGNIVYVSNYVLKVTGYTREEIIGKNPRIFKSGYQPEIFYKILWDTIFSGSTFKALFINKSKNGDLIYVEQTIYPIKFEEGQIMFMSIGEVINQESRNYQYIDTITSLPNFTFLKEYISNIFDKNIENHHVLIIIDIMNMTYINSHYGFDIGNKVLIEFSKKLKEIVEEWKVNNNISKEFVIARTGGDEFSIFLDNLEKFQLLNEFISNLQNKLNNFKIDDIVINYNAGISIYPVYGKTFDEIFNKVKLALHEVKKEGENTIRMYNEDISKRVTFYLATEKLVTRAFEEKLFKFYFQPYVDSKTSKVSGFESLIRIVEKDGKIHFPNEFIDFLENSKFIVDFERWGINEISEKIKKFKTNISFNLSTKGILNNQLFLILSSFSKDVLSKLILEITERNVLKDIYLSKEILYKIKYNFPEVKIAIDDFGTGYSSLTYLKELPIDKLKIDMSFIRNMLKTKKDLALVEVLVDLAKKFGYATIAEGVETPEQAKVLSSLGVDYLQGYLISKPLPEEEAIKLLENQ